MNKYNHNDNMTDKRKMLQWLEADRGVEIVGYNYSVFRQMAKLLKDKGYETTSPPNKKEYLDAVERANNKD